jgi:hypothetical protein
MEFKNMEVIWVMENVKRSNSFYGKSQLWMLSASVSLWRKYHPNHKTVLYCDEITNNFLSDLDMLILWDDVRSITYTDNINTEIFWSTSKTKIISETNIPLMIVDHDFLIFRNIDEYIGTELIYSYEERADNWYPPKNDLYNSRLTTPIEFINNFAANVSLFYLPDPIFARRYGLQTLKNHEEFTKMNELLINTNYMILSEQLMLKQLLSKEDIPHKCLSKNLFDCSKITFLETEINMGIWDSRESNLYYKHYGVEKQMIIDNKNGFIYEDIILFLQRCVNAGKLIDIEKLKISINKINKK